MILCLKQHFNMINRFYFSGQFTIKDVKPTPEGESSKIKVKARINIHGIVSIIGACLIEKKDSEGGEDEEMEIEQANQIQNQQDQLQQNAQTEQVRHCVIRILL